MKGVLCRTTMLSRHFRPMCWCRGRPAGTWAAIKAAQAGVDVILADRATPAPRGDGSVGQGCGTSTTVPELREAAMASAHARRPPPDRGWMPRVLDETHARMDNSRTSSATRFPVDAAGRPSVDDLQGPNTCADNASGAAPRCPHPRHTRGGASATTPTGWCRGRRCWTAGPWTLRVEAAAVCRRRRLRVPVQDARCDVNTGDGALMAVEAGRCCRVWSSPARMPSR